MESESTNDGDVTVLPMTRLEVLTAFRLASGCDPSGALDAALLADARLDDWERVQNEKIEQAKRNLAREQEVAPPTFVIEAKRVTPDDEVNGRVDPTPEDMKKYKRALVDHLEVIILEWEGALDARGVTDDHPAKEFLVHEAYSHVRILAEEA